MSNLLVHDMDTAWISSDPALLQVVIDNQTFMGAGAASNRLAAQAGALNLFAEFTPGAPLDLSEFEELRFWILANRQADGARTKPFFLEFSYTDAGDAPGEEHRWFIPVNRANVWEQRRIGIQADRRSAITQFRLECLADLPFTCFVDELLAVREEMLLDLEQALLDRLDGQVALPNVTNVAVNQTANPGETQLELAFSPGFFAGNRVLVQGGTAGDEIHQVISVDQDAGAGVTTLHFDPADQILGTLTAGVATVSVVVPVLAETPPLPTPATSPAIILTHLNAREDLDRTTYFTQRDSFRPRDELVMCSVRPAPRAYMVDYQLTVVAPERAQQLVIHTFLLQQLSVSQGLRINGAPAPLVTLEPPVLENRWLGQLAPVYVRIGTRLETAPRREQPWVRRSEVQAGPLDAPEDQEGIVLEL